MTNKVDKLITLSNVFAKKYFRVKADISQSENVGGVSDPNGFESIEDRGSMLGLDPNTPSKTSPIPGYFEVFEIKRKILPEFVKLTEEQQAKIIEELSRIKAQSHKP